MVALPFFTDIVKYECGRLRGIGLSEGGDSRCCQEQVGAAV